MCKIPTAEEFLRESNVISNDKYDFLTKQELMIGFAKIHVIEALKQASVDSNGYTEHCPDFAILEAYPLENIK